MHIFLADHAWDGYVAASVLEGASSVQRRSLMEDVAKFFATAIFVAVCVVLVFFLLRLTGVHFP